MPSHKKVFCSKYIKIIIMSNEVSTAIQRLFNECNQNNPDLIKIDKYVNECRINNEDINTYFEYDKMEFSLFINEIYLSRYSKYMTTLHMACCRNHYKIVEKLLDNKNHFQFSLNVNAIIDDSCKRMALHIACQGKFPYRS